MSESWKPPFYKVVKCMILFFLNVDCSYIIGHLVDSIKSHFVCSRLCTLYSLYSRFHHECLLSRLIANIGLHVYLKHKRMAHSYLNIHLCIKSREHEQTNK